MYRLLLLLLLSLLIVHIDLCVVVYGYVCPLCLYVRVTFPAFGALYYTV